MPAALEISLLVVADFAFSGAPTTDDRRKVTAGPQLRPGLRRRAEDPQDYGEAGVTVDLERMRAALEASGAFRVLRKLEPPTPIARPDGARTALFVDVETTGLAPRGTIIELAMAEFFYLESIVKAGMCRQSAGRLAPRLTTKEVP